MRLLLAVTGSASGAARFVCRSGTGQGWTLLTSGYCLRETLRHLPKIGPDAASVWETLIQPLRQLVPDAPAMGVSKRPLPFRKSFYGAAAVVLGAGAFSATVQIEHAQVIFIEDSATRIEAVEVKILNPSPDAAVNARIADLIRRELRAFPGRNFSRAAAEVALARARRTSPVSETSIIVAPGATGGVVVTVESTLTDARSTTAARGYFLSGDLGELPLLYDSAGTYIVATVVISRRSSPHRWHGENRRAGRESNLRAYQTFLPSDLRLDSGRR